MRLGSQLNLYESLSYRFDHTFLLSCCLKLLHEKTWNKFDDDNDTFCNKTTEFDTIQKVHVWIILHDYNSIQKKNFTSATRQCIFSSCASISSAKKKSPYVAFSMSLWRLKIGVRSSWSSTLNEGERTKRV